MYTFEQLNHVMYQTLSRFHENATNKHFGYVGDWELKIVDDNKFLGLCSYKEKIIYLNRWMVETCSDEQVLDTLRHECAHALAGVEYSKTGRCMGHGKLWKKWARLVGCDPRAKVSHEKLAEGSEKQFSKGNRGYKYYIVFKNGSSLEIVHKCKRRLKNLHGRQMKGRPETLGKLFHVECSKYDSANGDISALSTQLLP